MLMEKINETIAYIKDKTTLKPTIGLILGSGLGSFAEQLEDTCVIPYSEIPHFVHSTAPGHNGKLVIGRIKNQVICCMQGRFHYYEGYSMQEITYPIRVMKILGIEKLLITNACGALNPTFVPGDLMIVTDHINFMGNNPLIGQNEETFGPRFPDMTHAYDLTIRNIIKNTAKEIDLCIKEGIYISYSGPSFETPAEIKLFQNFGGSVVGMSTVPEVIVANHSNIKVAAISCITNLAAGILDIPLTENEVFEVAQKTGPIFVKLVTKIIEQL